MWIPWIPLLVAGNRETFRYHPNPWERSLGWLIISSKTQPSCPFFPPYFPSLVFCLDLFTATVPPHPIFFLESFILSPFIVCSCLLSLANLPAHSWFSFTWFAVLWNQCSPELVYMSWYQLKTYKFPVNLLIISDVRLLDWVILCCPSAPTLNFFHFQYPFFPSQPVLTGSFLFLQTLIVGYFPECNLPPGRVIVMPVFKLGTSYVQIRWSLPAFFSIPERSFQFLKVLKEDTLLLNEKGLHSSLSWILWSNQLGWITMRQKVDSISSSSFTSVLDVIESWIWTPEGMIKSSCLNTYMLRALMFHSLHIYWIW